MKFSTNGNAKLGENVVVNSREVGVTCPKSCGFLGNGCYAEKLEKLFPGTKPAARQNLIADWQQIRSAILYAKSSGKAIRIHERGDFLINGRLDKKYLNAWIRALQSLQAKDLPKIWVYTHLYNPKIMELARYGVAVYASCESDNQIEAARRAGFTLIAYADLQQKIAKRKRNGHAHSELPHNLMVAGERFVVCPEQTEGRDKVTCTGTITSKACGICCDGKENVVFLMH